MLQWVTFAAYGAWTLVHVFLPLLAVQHGHFF